MNNEKRVEVLQPGLGHGRPGLEIGIGNEYRAIREWLVVD
jgi:hypothetical protein